MSPDQIAALRTFLAASLAAPPRYGADPVTFPASSVVQSYGDFPRTAGPWCTFRLMTENGLAAEGDQWRESVRQVYRIAFSAGAGVNSVSLAPTNSDFAPSGVGPVGPALDATTLRDDTLALLQALEGPSHPATYVADDSVPALPAILATATEAARGVWLDLSTSGPSIDSSLVRDNLAVHTREPLEVVVSVQVYSRVAREGPSAVPNDDLNANNLLGKVRTRCMSGIATADLRAAGVAPRRFQPVRDLSGLLRGSQWETRAVLDMTCSVSRAIVEQPGTIESVELSGTAGTAPTINIDTRT